MKVQCPICKRFFNMANLAVHIRKMHKIELHQLDLPTSHFKYDGTEIPYSGNFLCQKCGTPLRTGFKYTDKLVVTVDLNCNCGKNSPIERLKAIFGKAWEDIYKKYYFNETLLERYIKKYGEKEGWKKYQHFCEASTHNRAFYIRKYGFVKGIEKFNEIIEKSKNTQENFIKRYGKEKGIKRYNMLIKKRKQQYNRDLKNFKIYGSKPHDHASLEFFTKMYGEEGKQRYQLTNKKKAVTIVDYLQKYGIVEGLKRYNSFIEQLKERQSLEYFIQQYGEKQGRSNYLKLKLIKVRAGTKNDSIPEALIKLLDRLIPSELHKYNFYNPKNHQHIVYDKEKDKMYSIDFVNTKLKLAIEINGTYHHANPYYYSENDLIFDTLASVIWKKDIEKLSYINKRYRVVVVWDHDLNNHFDIVEKILKETIRRCLCNI